MKTGFSFKGRHSNEFGITAATKNRPILPEVNRVTFEPDVYDGLIDISACNELGRATYAERVFVINIFVSADNIYKLQSKMSRLASWLAGKGELVFDDIPGVIWDAAVITAVDYMPERGGRKAVLAVSFNVKPFSRASFNVADGIKLGSKIPIGAKIPIGFPDTLTTKIVSSIPFGSATINAYNIGTAPTKPKITISAEETDTLDSHSPYTMNISCEDKSFIVTWSNHCRECVIDMDNGNALTKDDQGMYSAAGGVRGSFFELMPGENNITVHGVPAGATVLVSYTPKFLYSWEVD